MTTSTWASRPAMRAASPERLAALVESEVSRVDGLLFTATPREDLDEIGRFQQLKDQAFAGQLRAVVTALGRVPEADREFTVDEIALALGVGVGTAGNLMVLACRAAELPGLIEAVEHGMFSERHLRLVVDELHLVPLELEQRQALVLLALARFAGETPGELQKLLRKLILLIDPAAAAARKKAASADAGVRTYALPDGQGVLSAVGPLETVAAVRAALDAAVAAMPADDRSVGEREFAALASLITSGGSGSGGWAAHIVVPFSVALGGDLEVAEIPGFGPVLPSTGRELLERCDTVTQVAVDDNGAVIAVSDPMRVDRSRPVTGSETPTNDAASVYDLEPQDCALTPEVISALRSAPVIRDLTTPAYRPGTRLRRLVQARDVRCVFPGCTRPARKADLDHRIPWPRGRTSAENLQCLCRRHHRAKQAVFTVLQDDDGVTWWISRGGWMFSRRPQGY